MKVFTKRLLSDLRDPKGETSDQTISTVLYGDHTLIHNNIILFKVLIRYFLFI